MSTTVDEHTPAHDAAHDEGHPSERQYIVVALVLAVLTIIEVALYYVEGLPDNALVLMLGALAVAKFVGVVGWFMHLRFDNPLFRNIFLTGLVLAVIVYVVVLFTFHVFSG